MICRANQWTDLFMIGTSVMKELKEQTLLCKMYEIIKELFNGALTKRCFKRTNFIMQNVTVSFPQDSVLGPLLFIICGNNLPDEIKSSYKIFADT